MILNFKVNNQELTLNKKDSLANKSHKILKCVFDFNGEDWTDKEIFALLFNSKREVYQLHVENNMVIIPSTITEGNKFKISLYGEDLTAARITTNMVIVNLKESGYTTDIEDLVDIDPDIWTQIWTAIDNKSNIGHVHVVDDITDFPILSNVALSGSYNDLTNKPHIPNRTSDLINDGDSGNSRYVKDNDNRLTDARTPKAHTHPKSEITDFPESMPPTSHTHKKADITDFPATMPPSRHTHNKSDINDFQHQHVINDISDFPSIPTKTSDLVNDGDGRNAFVKNNDGRLSDTRNPKPHTHNKSDITNFPNLANVATTGNYNDLTNKPSIPSKISDLTDDSDFIEKSSTAGLIKNDGSIDTTQYLSSATLDNYIQKSNTVGLIKNDGTIDTNNYLTQHQDISGKLDKAQTNYKGKNVVVDSTTGNITFEDKPTIPTKISDLTDDSDFISKSNTSGLVKNDGTIDTTQYISQHQDLSNYIQKNSTSGLMKNDGTIDTTQYISDISGKVNYTDIVDNLTTNDSEKPLSAKQGKELAEMIGDIQTYVNR